MLHQLFHIGAGGNLENAEAIAAHESPHTTKIARSVVPVFASNQSRPSAKASLPSSRDSLVELLVRPDYLAVVGRAVPPTARGEEHLVGRRRKR